MPEINVRYWRLGDEAEMLHSGFPEFSIGQAVEIVDQETGELACALYVDDVRYDPYQNTTTYHCGSEEFPEPDLNDLVSKDTNRD